MKIIKEFINIADFRMYLINEFEVNSLLSKYPKNEYSLKFDFHLLNITASEKI